MNVTTTFPCGNGRILRADAEAIELELIAYSKGARYGCLRISEVADAREQLLILRPDSQFGTPSFGHKFQCRIWVRAGLDAPWKALSETKVERTPEAVHARIPLLPGEVCHVATEIPRPYAETTAELVALTRTHPDRVELHTPGASEEGRPLFLLRITDPANRATPGEERRPVIHIVCGEHATEFAGEEMGRGMLSFLLTPEAAPFRREFVFDLILNANPDGNVHGWHQYNARDWAAHSYTDGVDRSWHHEFVPFLLDEPGAYSPETVAWMSWLRTTRPAFYLSFHSWEGNDGRAGAYHAAPERLCPEMRAAVEALNTHAKAAAAGLGETFLTKASHQPGVRHLGSLLMTRGICAAYLPEAHGNWGQKRLQHFGADFLPRLLNDPLLAFAKYDPARWEALPPARP